MEFNSRLNGVNSGAGHKVQGRPHAQRCRPPSVDARIQAAVAASTGGNTSTMPGTPASSVGRFR